MGPQLARMASYRGIVIPALAILSLAAVDSPRLQDIGAAPIVDRVVPLLTADARVAGQSIPEPVGNAGETNPAEAVMKSEDDAMLVLHEPVVIAALTDSSEILPPEILPEAMPAASNESAKHRGGENSVDRTEILDECFVMDSCVDRYLWALYQRTPKEDTIKEEERRKVTIKKRGKTVTVTRIFTTHVNEDFAWKDRRAADRAAMTMMDYVVGGVDQAFKLRLFRLLYAADQAGFSPGITSAFRDDYRQSIASGLKAANDRSYHGGSSHGGYGHGLAADVVSVSGQTRAQRMASSEALWKWIDAHGKEFGIGRPYLDRDPPHIAPIDGKEYADHRSTAKDRPAKADHRLAARRNNHGAAKHARATRSPKSRST